MTEKTTNVDATPADPGVQISVEQILASILSLGGVTVPLEKLVGNYSNKSIAVNQDPDTKDVTFELADAPAPVENSTAE